MERRCAYHPVYQWLTGCEVVNHHTLSDFRVDHQEALDKLFAQLLAILSSEGLITLEQVVHDGTKVKAAASGKSFHREKTLRAHLEAAQQRVRAMGDPREEAGTGAPRRPGSGRRARRWKDWSRRWRNCRRCKPLPRGGRRSRSGAPARPMRKRE